MLLYRPQKNWINNFIRIRKLFWFTHGKRKLPKPFLSAVNKVPAQSRLCNVLKPSHSEDPKMRKRFWLTIVLAWAVCFFWSANLGATRYTYRNLNTFYDYDSFRVTRINASGQVAGTHIYPGTPTHACFGSGTRPLQDLGTLYPDPNTGSSYGMGLNKLATWWAIPVRLKTITKTYAPGAFHGPPLPA